MAKTKTITLAEATEQTVTRRRVLLGLGAATASAAVVVAPSIAKAETVARKENPELLKAHTALKDARKEFEEAKDALTWIADEWKHLWPLAPEALLGCGHVDQAGRNEDAERDIIGRYIKRDTSDLTRRMSSAKFRRENPSICFAVMSPEEASELLEFWKSRVPKGRTEKALATNKATREKFIIDLEEKLILAHRYRAETEAIRKAAGVQEAKDRIETAKKHVRQVGIDISNIEAFTLEGLCIKVDALTENPLVGFDHIGGTPGEVARFLEAVCRMHKGEKA